MNENTEPRPPLTPSEKVMTVILILVVLGICVMLYLYVMTYGT